MYDAASNSVLVYGGYMYTRPQARASSALYSLNMETLIWSRVLLAHEVPVCWREREREEEREGERGEIYRSFSSLGSLSGIPLHCCRWQPPGDPWRTASSAKPARS